LFATAKRTGDVQKSTFESRFDDQIKTILLGDQIASDSLPNRAAYEEQIKQSNGKAGLAASNSIIELLDNSKKE